MEISSRPGPLGDIDVGASFPQEIALGQALGLICTRPPRPCRPGRRGHQSTEALGERARSLALGMAAGPQSHSGPCLLGLLESSKCTGKSRRPRLALAARCPGLRPGPAAPHAPQLQLSSSALSSSAGACVAPRLGEAPVLGVLQPSPRGVLDTFIPTSSGA